MNHWASDSSRHNQFTFFQGILGYGRKKATLVVKSTDIILLVRNRDIRLQKEARMAPKKNRGELKDGRGGAILRPGIVVVYWRGGRSMIQQ